MCVGDVFQIVRGGPQTGGGPVVASNQLHKQEAVQRRAVSVFED